MKADPKMSQMLELEGKDFKVAITVMLEIMKKICAS